MRLLSATLERVFPRFRPRPEHQPRGSGLGAAATIEWLGTAGFVFRSQDTVILIDPFVSRPSLPRLVVSRVTPNDAEIEKHIPRRVDAIVCGHSHFDHVADAPRIALKTGARLIGSQSTCSWGRFEGLPESALVRVPARGASVQVGDVEIIMVPSRHGKVRVGPVPVPTLPGDVRDMPRAYGRVHEYRMGGTFGVLLRAPGLSVYHNGSADLVDAELEGHQADVLLACLAGRKSVQNYVARLAHALSPKLVIPAHHDAFFAPIDQGVRLLPGIDVPGFLHEVAQTRRGLQVVTPGYHEPVAVGRGADGAVIMERPA